MSPSDVLPWLMSAITIIAMWLAGNNNAWAWRLSLANQALWATWIVMTQAWGLLPMTAAMVLVSTRNLRAWALSQKDQE